MNRLPELSELCERFGVALLYVFGSRAEEVQRWLHGALPELAPGGSDVDVGVRPRPGYLREVYAKVALANAIEDFLGCERVDLVVLPEADPFLAVAVMRGERLFAEDPHEADEYELYLLRRAGDLAPFERERMARILGTNR